MTYMMAIYGIVINNMKVKHYYLTMNMDFFQPYKHLQYSVGAIYCTLMNLPRTERYKVENVLLIGLIPGPREPEEDIP